MKELFEFIVTQLEHGSNFNDIHTIIEKLRFEHVYATFPAPSIQSYEQMGAYYKCTKTMAVYGKTPSVDFLQTLFLEEFRTRRCIYETLMN